MKKKKFFQLYKYRYNLIDMLYFILYSDKEYFDETRNNLSLEDCNDKKFPIYFNLLNVFTIYFFKSLIDSGAVVNVYFNYDDKNQIRYIIKTSKDLDDFLNCGGLLELGKQFLKIINIDDYKKDVPVDINEMSILYNFLDEE